MIGGIYVRPTMSRQTHNRVGDIDRLANDVVFEMSSLGNTPKSQKSATPRPDLQVLGNNRTEVDDSYGNRWAG